MCIYIYVYCVYVSVSTLYVIYEYTFILQSVVVRCASYFLSILQTLTIQTSQKACEAHIIPVL